MICRFKRGGAWNSPKSGGANIGYGMREVKIKDIAKCE